MCSSESKTYIDAVLAVLHRGSQVLMTEKEMNDMLKREGIDPGTVHLRGANGLFEHTQNDNFRLNSTGLSILASHMSVKETRRASNWAIAVAIVALLLNLLTLWRTSTPESHNKAPEPSVAPAPQVQR